MISASRSGSAARSIGRRWFGVRVRALGRRRASGPFRSRRQAPPGAVGAEDDEIGDVVEGEAEEAVDVRERQVLQNAVNQLAAAGIKVHGELIEATQHDIADVIVQRANDLNVDIIVLGYQHYRGSTVADQVVRQRPHCSILLARPPESHR